MTTKSFRMYENILISLDNSVYSQYAEDIGILLAKKNKAKIIGFHVYSGRFHRSRFKILEGSLPEKYQKEDILAYQRNIHSVLINRGLELISLEYMKNIKEKCSKFDIPFLEKLVDGKNSDAIIDESKDCDLVIMGVQGIGEIEHGSKIGSNTKRVLRHSSKDLLIVKKNCEFNKIFVGIDGSEYSYKILDRVIELSKIFNAKITLLSSFDPGLHPTVFKSLMKVLSEEAGKVFKFKEQEQLHNMVIDSSLEDLYKNQLTKAKDLLKDHGINVDVELVHGKPYYAIYKRVLKDDVDLLIVGRHGMHQGTYDTIGSNAENLVELVPTNVLVVSATEYKERNPNKSIENKTSSIETDKVTWSDEANKRLENIPSFARPMAVLAIERYARENGIKVITPDVMKNARGRYES
jgi:nucleotide-binding universal stress UspA family protein